MIGGTQVGKSTLSEPLRDDFRARYRKARVHISDTKPRYRVERRVTGRGAKGLYKHWDHGSPVPGSVLVETPDDMDMAWQTGARVTICQSRRWIPAQDDCLAHFYSRGERGTPRLAIVDETVDHFHGNGIPRGSGSVIDIARSGGEQDLAGLYCSQRTRGVSPQLLEFLTKAYVFTLDNTADAARFGEFGAPVVLIRDEHKRLRAWWVPEKGEPRQFPRDKYVFDYWTKLNRTRVYGPYKLNLR